MAKDTVMVRLKARTLPARYELLRLELKSYKMLCAIMRAMIRKRIAFVISFCAIVITGTMIFTAMIVLFTLIHAQ